MSLFTKLLFAESGEPVLDLSERRGTYGPSYGNHIANERALRERWQKEPVDDITLPAGD